ncbi:RusA family crossover junction endodeoxyribonuclease [Staphylococcus agnetis]|uniref:RusA family crossover junction endodeoxyribonuclease n=1 Tax=Staphylococcus TaxID=1279 RepID=UPI000D1A508C|nr:MULTISPECIES: RusA family crossover junction endodeoxyribonuclease [Staphylococcus]MCO4357955.1 RusA family crossover junction endodeoxyribonuclease [Staphylococcus agnetis]MCO4363307.1 RusA family crossover junction endodeoxyribonuclease [Staphylococcus agnetis]NHM74112.1 RusA family crossover junction endodeoxyribonuclease [Staphylococcus sp. 11007852]NJH78823.1 RusA family crossover junction endodeoxyribonuclease [Staphylococcus agnetis]NJH83776.1 RusA family crossover junction endodeoxy
MKETRIEIFYTDKNNLDKPMGSPRPRFRRAGGFVQTYMPTTYSHHKNFIAEQMPNLQSENQLKLTIEFYFPPLKSWSKKLLSTMIGSYKRTKPDLDNLLKTVLDAGNEKLWKDDNQIVEIRTFKKYSDTARTVLVINELEEKDNG